MSPGSRSISRLLRNKRQRATPSPSHMHAPFEKRPPITATATASKMMAVVRVNRIRSCPRATNAWNSIRHSLTNKTAALLFRVLSAFRYIRLCESGKAAVAVVALFLESDKENFPCRVALAGTQTNSNADCWSECFHLQVEHKQVPKATTQRERRDPPRPIRVQENSPCSHPLSCALFVSLSPSLSLSRSVPVL